MYRAASEFDFYVVDQLFEGLHTAVPDDSLPTRVREVLEDGDALLCHAFERNVPVARLVRARAQMVDRALAVLWRHSAVDVYADGGRATLIAVGGYGRRELHPHSDIDLLLLLEDEPTESLREPITVFLAQLWDIGLKIGHSVRSLAECAAQARADVTVLTNLTEARVLEGDGTLLAELQLALAPEHMWDHAAFFRAKSEEQADRHEKSEATEYNLEPNLKNAPGGLRDLQTVHWIAQRLLSAPEPDDLVDLGLLTAPEAELLERARAFLWEIRWALHSHCERGEDRLLFEHQRTLAAQFGYQDDPRKLAVERFMQDYYQTAQTISELNELLLQHFEEVVFRPGSSKSIRPLNPRFRLRNGYLEATTPSLFTEHPSALLEVFVLLANDPDILGVRASTIRMVRRHADLIGDRFRNDPANAEQFMQLLRSPHFLVTQLQRMQRYGILGRYLPEFGRVIGQMQHDLFHVYTVDAHTLLLIRNLRKFRNPETAAEYPLLSHIVPRIPKYELLYIAGLYHDIAKGRGGDHSELGAIDARAFCARHHLSPRETNLVAWLVEAHLMMSMTAQRRDLSDPEVIHEFATAVGDRQRLDHLYLLTMADIQATNHTLWNAWRASLMRQLYTETQRALRRGLENPPDKQEWIAETQASALTLLGAQGLDEATVRRLWDNPGEEYFLRETAADIAWHVAAIHAHHDSQNPLVLIKPSTDQRFEGATQIFIYTRNRSNLFAAIAATMDQLELDIQDARIITSESDMALNTYYVLDANGAPLADDARQQHIRDLLTKVLAAPDDYPQVVDRRVPRRLKQFPIPTEAWLSTDAQGQYTVLEVISADRPGLLARIGQIFMQFGIYLAKARIATLGERVDDVFFITDAAGAPLSDPERCRRLTDAIRAQLNADLQREKPAT